MEGAPLAAFAMGLLGSAHCVAMCGGVVGMLSGGVAPDLRRRPAAHLGYLFAYNAGRVGSYAIFGALFGALALGFRHALAEGQLVLRAAAGVLMFGLGLHLLGLFPRFTSIERLGAPLFRRISPIASRLLPVRSHAHALLLGSLWGWVPCGMVYTALALATSSGHPRGAALTMAAFGLGTLPAMIVSGSVAGHVLAKAGSAWVRRSAGVVIAVMGVMSISVAAASSEPAESHGGEVVCHGH